MEQPPATAGIVMANWYWKVVRQFVSERFGISLSRSSCLNWLHRLGFAFKRPKKRLLKPESTEAMGRGVDTRDDGQGKANGASPIPIDGDEGGVR